MASPVTQTPYSASVAFSWQEDTNEEEITSKKIKCLEKADKVFAANKAQQVIRPRCRISNLEWNKNFNPFAIKS